MQTSPATAASMYFPMQLVAPAINNGLSFDSPPMGWRSWNAFGRHVSDAKMRRAIDAIVSRGRLVDGRPTSLLDLGYINVGLDGGWPNCRGSTYRYHDAQGLPLVNSQLFPDMRACALSG